MTTTAPHSSLSSRPPLAWAFLAVAVALAPLVRAQSTGTITGRVINEATGDYLKNALVSIVGTDRTTVADFGGTFTLTNLPAGVVRLKATCTGLDPAEHTVTVEAGTNRGV